MNKKMTKKQKFIVSCCNPYYGGFATRKEVKEAKLLARGKYWVEDLEFGTSNNYERDTYCAFSPTGRIEFFIFAWHSPATKSQKERWKKEARQAARLWAKGKYKEAEKVYNDSYLYSEMP